MLHAKNECEGQGEASTRKNGRKNEKYIDFLLYTLLMLMESARDEHNLEAINNVCEIEMR